MLKSFIDEVICMRFYRSGKGEGKGCGIGHIAVVCSGVSRKRINDGSGLGVSLVYGALQRLYHV